MNRGIVFSEYRRADGLFTSQVVQGFRPPDSPETAWLPGRYDHRSQRVESGEVVAHAPDPPDEAARHRRRVLAQIAELERRQARPQRELLLDPGNRVAYVKLREIEAQITELRAGLREVIN